MAIFEVITTWKLFKDHVDTINTREKQRPTKKHVV